MIIYGVYIISKKKMSIVLRDSIVIIFTLSIFVSLICLITKPTFDSF